MGMVYWILRFCHNLNQSIDPSICQTWRYLIICIRQSICRKQDITLISIHWAPYLHIFLVKSFLSIIFYFKTLYSSLGVIPKTRFNFLCELIFPPFQHCQLPEYHPDIWVDRSMIIIPLKLLKCGTFRNIWRLTMHIYSITYFPSHAGWLVAVKDHIPDTSILFTQGN